jgi:hypothetical protein
MLDRLEELSGVRHFAKAAIEILRLREPFPKLASAMLRDELSGTHSEQPSSAFIEVGQNAVGIEE